MSKENDDVGESDGSDIKYIKIKNYLLKKYRFRFNVVDIDIEYTPLKEESWIVLNEDDLSEELYERGYSGFEKQLATMLRTTKFRTPYNPIIKFFENLPEWDQQYDEILTLSQYVDTTDNDFFDVMFKKMLVRMIAQAFNAIPFNKQCLVLFSQGQNPGKTYFWEHLTRNTFLWEYTKKNPDIIGKESKRSLAEYFVLNLDELSTLFKSEINQVKALFAESTIKIRLPYGRKDSTLERKASFVGSTNKRDFLTDETGNVRWIVFDVKTINHNFGKPGGYVDVDVHRVWAQAYWMFKNGFEFQLTADEIAHSERNNEQFSFESTEYQLLVEHFESVSKEDGGSFYTATNVLEYFIKHVGTGLSLKAENIGKALVKMKVPRVGVRNGARSDYGYWLRERPKKVDMVPYVPKDKPLI